MNDFNIVFCIAENTYMYLPVYLARDKGIFTSVFQQYGIEKKISIRFVTPSAEKQQKGGDWEAVNTMLHCSANDGNRANTLYIAIADPTTAFKSYKNISSKNDIRIIGQLINKNPFWIVKKRSETDSNCNNLGSIKEYQERLFFAPQHRYITAESCTRYVFKENHMDENNKELVQFNDVINKCIENDAIGLTGDLYVLAEKNVNNEISILYHLSKISNDRDLKNIASVLITDSQSCQQYKANILPAIIESIQNAIFIIYSSPSIAQDVCKSVLKTHFHKDVDIAIVNKIIDIIDEDKFYPMSLDIKPDDWINTIYFYGNPFDSLEFPNMPSETNDIDELLNNLYKKMYEESPAKIVERKMIEKFGVSCQTFDKEIEHYVKSKKIEYRKEMIRKYGDKVTKILLIGLTILLVLFAVVIIHYNNDSNSILSYVISIASCLLAIVSLITTGNSRIKKIVNNQR